MTSAYDFWALDLTWPGSIALPIHNVCNLLTLSVLVGSVYGGWGKKRVCLFCCVEF